MTDSRPTRATMNAVLAAAGLHRAMQRADAAVLTAQSPVVRQAMAAMAAFKYPTPMQQLAAKYPAIMSGHSLIPKHPELAALAGQAPVRRMMQSVQDAKLLAAPSALGVLHPKVIGDLDRLVSQRYRPTVRVVLPETLPPFEAAPHGRVTRKPVKRRRSKKRD